MAWWGQAISAGPNINNPFMDSAAAHTAWLAVTEAQKLAPKATPLEQELIAALAIRYKWPTPADRKSLDVAYADAMREVWKKHPDNPDAGAFFADAMMNLRPWDLWTPQGVPQPGTEEIVATIERVLALKPDHPGGCHFYVHTMEASPTPEKALPAADILRDRIPGSGHLVHMPSHIDIRVGAYDDAVKSNMRGIAVDSSWSHQPGFYAFYRAHNYHFLAYAAMFEGRRELALWGARGIGATIPLDVVRAYPDFLDAFMPIPIHVMVRFGMWDEILAEPRPPEDLQAWTAFWHYGRTVAYAALGKVKEAEAEFSELQKSYAAVPESRLLGNNSARTVLQVGLPMAEGELEYRRGNHAKAFALLRQAIERDDSLRYDEPWGWMMPVRHSLGALLLEQGKVKDAEAVYRTDLLLHPNNGWALHGLAECLHKQAKHEEAMATDERFKAAWARADISIRGSCYCRTGG
jgi:tetratricopeptide (TPR) repeat protein